MGNWDSGQVSSLASGQTLTCATLSPGQLYGIFLYNSAQNDNSCTVTVNVGNAFPPVPVTVPGTTAHQGLASIALVSGSDTQTVAISIVNQPNASITAWIGSVRMPTNTAGLNNMALPANGQPQPFGTTDRYFAVPASSWQALTINSPTITQFISVQFIENFATVNIVNPTQNATAAVYPVGSVKLGSSYVINLASNPPQSITTEFQGNGTQFVWMNADNSQDSQAATIALQPLSAAQAKSRPRVQASA